MKGIKNHKIKISSTFSERCQEIKKRGIIPSFLGLPKLDSNHARGVFGCARLRPLTVTTLRKDPIGCARLRSPPLPPCERILLVAPAYGRHRYHPAKGSFARFPSGASLNAIMQFTLLPSELGQNLSFSGVDYALTSE